MELPFLKDVKVELRCDYLRLLLSPEPHFLFSFVKRLDDRFKRLSPLPHQPDAPRGSTHGRRQRAAREPG